MAVESCSNLVKNSHVFHKTSLRFDISHCYQVCLGLGTILKLTTDRWSGMRPRMLYRLSTRRVGENSFLTDEQLECLEQETGYQRIWEVILCVKII
jgi:hypothetical protein